MPKEKALIECISIFRILEKVCAMIQHIYYYLYFRDKFCIHSL